MGLGEITGIITDGLSLFAAGKNILAEKEYQLKLLEFVRDWVQFGELSSNEKEGICELLQRNSPVRDSLFRAVTTPEFIEALRKLGVLDINARTQAQSQLLEQLKQDRFNVGASPQEKIILERLEKIQQDTQDNMAYQRLLENPILEGSNFIGRHIGNAGIESIEIGHDGKRSYRFLPNSGITVIGGQNVEDFLQKDQLGKTAELKIGIDDVEISYFPPQLKDILGATPYAVLTIKEQLKIIDSNFTLFINDYYVKVFARVAFYPDDEFFTFKILNINDSINLEFKIERNLKRFNLNLKREIDNVFTEKDLSVLQFIDFRMFIPVNPRLENPEKKIELNLATLQPPTMNFANS